MRRAATRRGASARRVPAFRRLCGAWLLSNLGDGILFLTLAIWVKDLTGSSAAAGLVFAALGVPVLLAPVAGQVADRVSRRRLLVVANVAVAGAVLLLLGVRGGGQVPLLLAVTFLYGCAGYVTGAAQSGLLRDLLADDELASANSILTTIDQGLRLVSPLLGAGLYVAVGMTWVVILTVGCFLGAAAVLGTLRVDESQPAPPGDAYLAELGAGFAHLRRTPVLLRLTVAVAAAMAVTGLTNVTNLEAIEHGLGSGPELLAVLAALQGVGALVGGPVAGALVRRWGEQRAVAVGLLLLAVGISSTLTRSVALIGAGALVAGVGLPWVFVGFATLRQRLTPPEVQGRTASATGLAFNGPQTVVTMSAAALVVAVDYRLLIAVTVAVLVISGLAVVGHERRRPAVAPQHDGSLRTNDRVA